MEHGGEKNDDRVAISGQACNLETGAHSAHAGHDEVGNDHLGGMVNIGLHPLYSVLGGHHLEQSGGESIRKNFQEKRVVVNEKDFGPCISHA